MQILIIEDEYSLADTVREFFRREGHHLDICTDGGQGLLQAKSDIYDVILLDIMLPSMNGYDVLKELRKAGSITPVILITAKAALDDKLQGFDVGADDYVTKPFEMKELLARVYAVCRRHGKQNVNGMQCADLILFPKKCVIQNKMTEEEVALSAKEFRLLEYLMINCGQIVSREQVTTRIWGITSETEYNNVDVYISFLRKKMNFIGVKPTIQTVRGVGYKLLSEEEL